MPLLFFYIFFGKVRQLREFTPNPQQVSNTPASTSTSFGFSAMMRATNVSLLHLVVMPLTTFANVVFNQPVFSLVLAGGQFFAGKKDIFKISVALGAFSSRNTALN